MIKSEELMIGDWVYVKDYNENLRVLEINCNYITFGEGYLHGYKDIEPIPITSKILEKNGFERGEDKDLWAWHSELERVIWIEDGLTKIMSVFTDSNYAGWCYDIHELQHALRLCGISKNIEL